MIPLAWLAAAGTAAALVALGLGALASRASLLKLVLGVVVLAKGAILGLVVAALAVDAADVGQAGAFLAMGLDVAVTALALAILVALQRHGSGLDARALRRDAE